MFTCAESSRRGDLAVELSRGRVLARVEVVDDARLERVLPGVEVVDDASRGRVLARTEVGDDASRGRVLARTEVVDDASRGRVLARAEIVDDASRGRVLARTEVVDDASRGRVLARAEVVDDASREQGDVDLVVALGLDTPVVSSSIPTWRWDVPEPGEPRFTQRQARLAIEARLPLLELPLPSGTLITPTGATDIPEAQRTVEPRLAVEAQLAGTPAARAVMQQVGAFAVLELEAEAAPPAIADSLIADRVCLARSMAIHALYATASTTLARAGFAPASSLPPDVASALATRDARGAAAVLQLADDTNASTNALLDADITRELAGHGTLVPPWVKHPEIPRRSLGWRMGSGEWYLWMWRRWWDGLSAEAHKEYVARWAPTAPADWLSWLPR